MKDLYGFTIKTPRCSNCRFFAQDINYRSDGFCLLDDNFTREFYSCNKLDTDEKRREAKNINYPNPPLKKLKTKTK